MKRTKEKKDLLTLDLTFVDLTFVDTLMDTHRETHRDTERVKNKGDFDKKKKN